MRIRGWPRTFTQTTLRGRTGLCWRSDRIFVIARAMQKNKYKRDRAPETGLSKPTADDMPIDSPVIGDWALMPARQTTFRPLSNTYCAIISACNHVTRRIIGDYMTPVRHPTPRTKEGAWGSSEPQNVQCYCPVRSLVAEGYSRLRLSVSIRVSLAVFGPILSALAGHYARLGKSQRVKPKNVLTLVFV